jgi:hypothetical protein
MGRTTPTTGPFRPITKADNNTQIGPLAQDFGPCSLGAKLRPAHTNPIITVVAKRRVWHLAGGKNDCQQ